MTTVKKDPVIVPKAKKGIHVEPIYENTLSNNPADLDIPGWVFSWQNIETNEKKGWGIHRPVLRDSELGEAVAKQFGIMGESFSALKADSNLFYYGVDAVLAYTSQELYDKAIAQKQIRADAQAGIIGEDAKVQMRHANISKGVKRPTKKES